jgi:glycosyltransferase involved in cell wall biosynthesis
MNIPSPFQEREYPSVSVVTPSYNAMPYIKESIESIGNQDYPAIEHIVMDGNSTDGTQEMLRQYPNIIWVSEPDRGQSHALNKAFRLVHGDIIGWLNADDTYQPGAISNAVEYLQSHPDVDLVYSDVQVVDENNRPIRVARAEPFTLEKLLVNNIVKQPTVFMRKRVLDKLGGVNENLRYVMDYEFWLRAGMFFKLQYLPGIILTNFRFCLGTKSHDDPTEFHLEWMKVLTDFMRTPNLGKEFRGRVKQARRLTARSYYFSLMVQAAKDGKQVRAFTNFLQAISNDWMSIFNSGVWKLFFRVLFRNTTA